MSERVVLRRSRAASVFVWGLLLPFWVVFAILMVIIVTASNMDARGRVVAGAVLLLVVVYLWWFVRRIPRLRDTLVITIDGDTITGTQSGDSIELDRREVWFAEITEVHYKGVPFVGFYGHDGRLLAGWETLWSMAASSWTARRRLNRAGVPWVHVYNGKVWKRDGVGRDVDVFVLHP